MRRQRVSASARSVLGNKALRSSMWNCLWSTTSVKIILMSIGCPDFRLERGEAGAGVRTARGAVGAVGAVVAEEVCGARSVGDVHVPGRGPSETGSTSIGVGSSFVPEGSVVGGGGAGAGLALAVSEESSESLLIAIFSLGSNMRRPNTGVLGDGIDGAEVARGGAVADGAAGEGSRSSSFSQLVSWRMVVVGGVGVDVP